MVLFFARTLVAFVFVIDDWVFSLAFAQQWGRWAGLVVVGSTYDGFFPPRVCRGAIVVILSP